VTDPTTPSAAQLRQDAELVRYEAERLIGVASTHLKAGMRSDADRIMEKSARYDRAAAALDAEAARLEREAADAPTLVELDAAVEEAVNEINYAVWTADAVAARVFSAALITAAEARGAAKERERKCTGGFTCGTLGGIGGVYCRICGGRVRVEGQ
jgi:adenosylcobinamide amidohydrolase